MRALILQAARLTRRSLRNGAVILVSETSPFLRLDAVSLKLERVCFLMEGNCLKSLRRAWPSMARVVISKAKKIQGVKTIPLNQMAETSCRKL